MGSDLEINRFYNSQFSLNLEQMLKEIQLVMTVDFAKLQNETANQLLSSIRETMATKNGSLTFFNCPQDETLLDGSVPNASEQLFMGLS